MFAQKMRLMGEYLLWLSLLCCSTVSESNLFAHFTSATCHTLVPMHACANTHAVSSLPNTHASHCCHLGQMGLCYNGGGGGAGDRCWDQGMFRGYVSGVFRGIMSYFTCNFGGTLRFRGHVSGYVSRVCNPCALLKPGPPKKHRPKSVSDM